MSTAAIIVTVIVIWFTLVPLVAVWIGQVIRRADEDEAPETPAEDTWPD